MIRGRGGSRGRLNDEGGWLGFVGKGRLGFRGKGRLNFWGKGWRGFSGEGWRGEFDFTLGADSFSAREFFGHLKGSSAFRAYNVDDHGNPYLLPFTGSGWFGWGACGVGDEAEEPRGLLPPP